MTASQHFPVSHSAAHLSLDPMQHLKAVIFDWAGTTVDYGSQGPVQAFVESFASFKVAITPAEAREPMGMDKRQHVATLCAMPRIAAAWQAAHHSPPTESSIDAVYKLVEASMISCITRYSTPIDGTIDAVAAMRACGLRIGSCTGYPRSVAENLAAEAQKYGYVPDVLVCATDVTKGRPAPDMCNAILKAFGIEKGHQAVKIGDTVNDVLEGSHAGMWVIGITLSGSMAGLNPQEVQDMSAHDRDVLEKSIADKLQDAGAHFTAPDVQSCLPILEIIDRMATEGKRP